MPKHQSSLDNPRTLVGTLNQDAACSRSAKANRCRYSTWRVDWALQTLCEERCLRADTIRLGRGFVHDHASRLNRS